VPMMPVVEGNESTSYQILYYTLALIPVTLLLVYPLHVMGAVYGTIALLLGGVFVQKAWKLVQEPFELMVAKSLFKYSILYLMLLCAGMGIDSLPVTRQLTADLFANLQTLIGTLHWG
jgi:protoheme IX farnesyltransferase